METCRRVGGLRGSAFILWILTDTMQLHTAREQGDGLLLEHANELIDSLEAKGIKAAPEDEQDGGGWKMWMRTAETSSLSPSRSCAQMSRHLSWKSLTSAGESRVAIATYIQTFSKGSSMSDHQDRSASKTRLTELCQRARTTRHPNCAELLFVLRGRVVVWITKQNRAHVIGSKFVSASTEL